MRHSSTQLINNVALLFESIVDVLTQSVQLSVESPETFVHLGETLIDPIEPAEKLWH